MTPATGQHVGRFIDSQVHNIRVSIDFVARLRLRGLPGYRPQRRKRVTFDVVREELILSRPGGSNWFIEITRLEDAGDGDVT